MSRSGVAGNSPLAHFLTMPPSLLLLLFLRPQQQLRRTMVPEGSSTVSFPHYPIRGCRGLPWILPEGGKVRNGFRNYCNETLFRTTWRYSTRKKRKRNEERNLFLWYPHIVIPLQSVSSWIRINLCYELLWYACREGEGRRQRVVSEWETWKGSQEWLRWNSFIYSELSTITWVLSLQDREFTAQSEGYLKVETMGSPLGLGFFGLSISFNEPTRRLHWLSDLMQIYPNSTLVGT